MDEKEEKRISHLLIKGLDDVIDGLSQNSGQSFTHGSVCKRVLVITTVCGPWWVVGVNTGGRAWPATGGTELVLGLGFGWKVAEAEHGFGDGLDAGDI